MALTRPRSPPGRRQAMAPAGAGMLGSGRLLDRGLRTVTLFEVTA